MVFNDLSPHLLLRKLYFIQCIAVVLMLAVSLPAQSQRGSTAFFGLNFGDELGRCPERWTSLPSVCMGRGVTLRDLPGTVKYDVSTWRHIFFPQPETPGILSQQALIGGFVDEQLQAMKFRAEKRVVIASMRDKLGKEGRTRSVEIQDTRGVRWTGVDHVWDVSGATVVVECHSFKKEDDELCDVTIASQTAIRKQKEKERPTAGGRPL